MLDEPGGVVGGRYTLLEVAGHGGMATVWRAMARGAEGFEREVALKRIHSALADDEHFVRMFVEEARVGSKVQHPNVVQVLDFGHDDLGHYLVMDWVEGLDLATWARSHFQHGEQTPWPLVAGIGIEVLRGLAAMHDRVRADGEPAPIYHRDVAPGNVLLSIQGQARLTDLGLARAMDRVRMTRPDVVKGKVSYLAPELTLKRDPSPQSDIWAVGVVLWETLTGERMFDAPTDAEVVFMLRDGRVPPLRERRPDVPGELAGALHGALERYPSARWETASAMADALSDCVRSADHRTDARALGESVRGALRRARSDEAGDYVDSDPIILLDRPRSSPPED